MSDIFTTDEFGHVFYRTRKGHTVECLPVADLYMAVGSSLESESLPEPEPPMYEVVGIGGETEKFYHDEKSIEEDKTLPEEKDAWVQYLADKTEWEVHEAHLSARRHQMRALFLAREGLKLVDFDLEAWALERASLYGFTLRENMREQDLQEMFLDSELLRDTEDAFNIMIGIFKASGMDQEVLDQVEESFRDTMGTKGRADSENDPEETSDGEQKEGSEILVRRSEVHDPGHDDTIPDSSGLVRLAVDVETGTDGESESG